MWVISLHCAHRRKKLASCFGPKSGERCMCVCIYTCACVFLYFHPVWAQHSGIFNFCRFIEKKPVKSFHMAAHTVQPSVTCLRRYVISCLLLHPWGFKKHSLMLLWFKLHIVSRCFLSHAVDSLKPSSPRQSSFISGNVIIIIITIKVLVMFHIRDFSKPDDKHLLLCSDGVLVTSPTCGHHRLGCRRCFAGKTNQLNKQKTEEKLQVDKLENCLDLADV